MRTSLHHLTPALLLLLALHTATAYAATQTIPMKKGSVPFPVGSNEPHLGEHGPRTLTIKRGETFVVSLSQNIDTHGYSWTLINNPEAVRELEEAVIVPPNITGIIGDVAEAEWHFIAEKQGTHPLVFCYRRPQQTPDAEHTIVFDITVVN